MNPAKTLDAGYFDALYQENPDPWDFETSAYEAAKYAHSIDALGGRRYRCALEVGCSIGVLTRRIANEADRVLAVDISARALDIAIHRDRRPANVTFALAGLPDDLPSGPFDLIVLSEVLYYLGPGDLERATDTVLSRLTPGGDVLLVHWLGETDYPLTGDAASEGFIRRTGRRLTIVQQARGDRYRLDLLRGPD